MDRHQWRGWRPPRVALLVLAVALALTGCLLDSPPAPPATPTPTPPPTPTPTVQARVVYPTAVPTGLPAPAPTSAPTPVAELRGAGQLLYIGTLDGRAGVIAVNADGTDRVLLAEGTYRSATWAPDGARFVATGATDSGPGGGPIQVDLYAADGRRLQRFAFEGFSGGQSWSPDGRRLVLAVNTPPASNTTPDRSTNATWLLDEDGARELTLGGQTSPGPWTPDGRLTLAVLDDTSGDGGFDPAADRLALWTVDATGGDPRRLGLEGAYPLDWTADGRTLYAVGGFQAVRSPEGYTSQWPTNVLALDMAGGAVRTVITIDELVTRLPRGVDPPPTFRLGWGRVSPTGDRLALTLQGVPGRQGPPPFTLVVIDGAGNPVWRDDTPAGGFLQGMTWSPDGTRLAVLTGQVGPSRGNAPVALRVIAVATGATFTILDSTIPNAGGIPDITFRWSPDGRWLALGRAGGLTIAAADPPARSWMLAPGGRAPDWRPAPGR